MIDLIRLEHVRQRSGKIEARCPACAEAGKDTDGDNLAIFNSGRFDCIANQGPAGKLHRKRIWELVGARDTDKPLAPLPPKFKPARKATIRIPSLRPLTVGEMAQIARARGWESFVGLDLLTRRGLLHAGEVWDDGRTWPAWIACDSTRRNADARRVDCQAWAGIGGKKAKALTSGARDWPIGCDAIGDRHHVVLCEGVPDFAASLLVAWWEGLNVDRIAPVCMTGASNPIHAEALHYFTDKRIRIAIHDDAKGREAAQRWADQLYRARAVKVDGFDFSGMVKRDGRPLNDLADFCTLIEGERDEAPRVFRDFTP